METPKISCRWNPSLFAGWRRWSLLIFISLLLFFIASRVPLFSVENNPALQAWESFYLDQGENPEKRWPEADIQGLTFDQQAILKVRTTYDRADQSDVAPNTLNSLRRIAGITTHMAEGYVVVAQLLLLFLLSRMIPSWKSLQKTVLGALLGAVTAGVAVQGLKILIGRGRPNELIYRAWPDWQPFTLEHSHHSLPSGHSTAAGVMVMMLCVIFPRWSALWCLMGIWICATRVLTAEHWPSDTLPGLVLGGFCAAFWIGKLQPREDLNQSDTSSQRPLE